MNRSSEILIQSEDNNNFTSDRNLRTSDSIRSRRKDTNRVSAKPEEMDDIINNYQSFALEQLRKWNEVNKMVEHLKDRKNSADMEGSVKDTIERLQAASEINIQTLQHSIKKLVNISHEPQRGSIKPVKPELSLDMNKIAGALQQSKTKEITNLGAGGSIHSRSFEGGQPSQSHSYVNSAEKWVDPGNDLQGKKNIDLARALLIDGEGMTSNRSSQRFSVNELRYELL